MRNMAAQMYVSPSTVSRWKNHIRQPNAGMIVRLSEIPEVEVSLMLNTAAHGCDCPDVILAEGIKPILPAALPVLKELKPITSKGVQEQLGNLRYSSRTGGKDT